MLPCSFAALHASGPPVADGFLFAVLALAGLGGTLLLGLALAALRRRRSWSYLLVALALGALLARTLVAALTMGAVVDDATHHLLEHGLDVVMAALVVTAVYTARTARGGSVEDSHE